MVPIVSLWVPILLSAVVVFLASFVVHMLLRYHWTDFSRMPGEDNVMAAIRKEGVPPGAYNFPHCSSPKEMSSEEIVKKWEQGPVGFLTVIPAGPPRMGGQLVQWFVYTVVVGILVAYVTGRALAEGVEYLQVFRIAGTAAFLTYAGAEPVMSIWHKRNWSTSIKFIIDGLIYALLTAGIFGWLWPR